jgi:hypothetical protein
MSLPNTSRSIGRMSQRLHPIRCDIFDIPIASSSKTPLTMPSQRILRPPAESTRRYLSTSLSRTDRQRTAIHRNHRLAYTSTPIHRYMSSLAQPIPSLSDPSIPFPTTAKSSSTSHHGLNITPPSLSAIQEEGYLDDDIQLIPPSEAWINVTPEAIRVCYLSMIDTWDELISGV